MKVQESLGEKVGRDILFLSITLDPDVDSPEVLKGYAERQGVRPGWLFLTGKLDDIELVRRRLGVVDPDPEVDADRAQHSGLVVIGNEPAGDWSAMPALLAPPRLAEIVRDVARIESR